MQNEIFSVLKSSSKQLQDSAYSMLDVVNTMMDNREEPLSETLIAQISDLEGNIFNITCGTDSSLVIQGVSEQGELTRDLLSTTIDGLDLSTKLNLVTGTVQNVQGLVQSQLASIDLNGFLADVSDTIANYGSIPKSLIADKLQNLNIFTSDKINLSAMLSMLPHEVSGKDWISVLGNLYSSFKRYQADDKTIQLSDTRGQVKTFLITALSLVGMVNVAQFVSAVLMLIPSVITRIIGAAGLIISAFAKNILNIDTNIKYDDNALHPYISAPAHVITINGQSAIASILDGPASLLKTVGPLDVFEFKRSNGDTSFSTFMNGFIKISLKASACRDLLRSMITMEPGGVLTQDEFVVSQTSNVLYRDWMNSKYPSDMSTILFDYVSEQDKMLNPKYRANLLLMHLALYVFILNPVIYLQNSSIEYRLTKAGTPGRYTWDSSNADILGFFRHTLWCACELAEMNESDFADSDIGINEIGRMSDMINFLQDLFLKGAKSFTSSGVTCVFGNGNTALLYYASTAQSLVGRAGYDYSEHPFSEVIFLDSTPTSMMFELPEYSRTTLIAVLAASATTALIAALTITGIKKFIKKKCYFKRLSKAEELRSLRSSYIENPTESNAQALYKANKKYNLLSRFCGFPAYDPVNDWFDYDVSANGTNFGGIALLEQRLSTLHKSVTGEVPQ